MNPKRAEDAYYTRIIQAIEVFPDSAEFEVFAYRELIAILQEEKVPNLSLPEREMLKRIRTNAILLILAFAEHGKNAPIKNNFIQKKKAKEYVKKLMKSII